MSFTAPNVRKVKVEFEDGTAFEVEGKGLVDISFQIKPQYRFYSVIGEEFPRRIKYGDDILTMELKVDLYYDSANRTYKPADEAPNEQKQIPQQRLIEDKS